jgi:two-component system, NarL family, response regulator NreC
MTTIVLADDHPIVRRGLRTLLETERGLQIVGEAGDGLEAVHLVESLQPDVLIVDVLMPGLSGLEVTRQVSQRTAKTRVIVLSMYANEAYVLEALRNGASGYVLKDSGITDLVQAVRDVVAGRRYLSAPLSERAIAAYVEKAHTRDPTPYESLTSREREVLHLVAEGHTSAQIAKRLYLSPRTVETHRANLMRKLGLRSQADLTRYAIERGILPAIQDPD